MAIRYFNDDTTYRLPHKRLTSRWLVSCAGEEGCHIGDISYVYCSSERLLEINRQFLGHDYFTDVITFDDSDLEDTRTLNGEIYIDTATVADNAKRYGSTALMEMRRVIVHGLLHLCGHGDKTPPEEKRMHELEDHYLQHWDEL